MTNTTRRHWIWYLAAGLLALAALVAGILISTPAGKPKLDLATATLYPADFRPVAEFTLTAQNGRPFTLDDLKGRWNLVFFGYTACPDVCPMTLYKLQQVNAALKKNNRNVRTVFVSVDPNRDTPEKINRYLEFFNPEFVGLSGSNKALQPLTGSLGVFYTEPPSTEESGYIIDHSAGIFLVGPDGKPKALFSAPHDSKSIAQDVLRIVNHYE